MFKGAMTAIVTPFTEDGSIDEEALRGLVNFQVENKIDGIIPCGTTGESPTLDHDEHQKVIEIVIDAANGKTKVIAGAGSNSTKEAVEMTKKAADLGADGTLHVCPYYNKPTQEGLFRHFSAIAKATDTPIIVYNIKGRTAINMETATLARLAKEHSNIVAVQEASGDINQMKDVVNTLPKEFDVLSGDDKMTFPLMEAGGKGVISVASNIIPNEVHEFAQLGLNGNFEKMIDKYPDKPHPAHTVGDVPMIVFSERYKGRKLKSHGRLADVAPTLLEMMGLHQPEEMTGKSLLAD